MTDSEIIKTKQDPRLEKTLGALAEIIYDSYIENIKKQKENKKWKMKTFLILIV